LKESFEKLNYELQAINETLDRVKANEKKSKDEQMDIIVNLKAENYILNEKNIKIQNEVEQNQLKFLSLDLELETTIKSYEKKLEGESNLNELSSEEIKLLKAKVQDTEENYHQIKSSFEEINQKYLNEKSLKNKLKFVQEMTRKEVSDTLQDLEMQIKENKTLKNEIQGYKGYKYKKSLLIAKKCFSQMSHKHSKSYFNFKGLNYFRDYISLHEKLNNLRDLDNLRNSS